jgi:hypothetical protein
MSATWAEQRTGLVAEGGWANPAGGARLSLGAISTVLTVGIGPWPKSTGHLNIAKDGQIRPNGAVQVA